jgi:hypothetical protein
MEMDKWGMTLDTQLVLDHATALRAGREAFTTESSYAEKMTSHNEWTPVNDNNWNQTRVRNNLDANPWHNEISETGLTD